MRVVEGTLHSAKQKVSKKRGTARACKRGWVERGREAARTYKVVTLETFHAWRGWLKARAWKKVACTRQSEMVSKSEAPRASKEGIGGEDERRRVRIW